MPLQADPTVAYAVAKEGGTHPRGPPGRPSVQHLPQPRAAAGADRQSGAGPPSRRSLEPADVPYLYFVAIDDRAHHFSTTLEEHNQAVARYRQYRARRTRDAACARQRPGAIRHVGRPR